MRVLGYIKSCNYLNLIDTHTYPTALTVEPTVEPRAPTCAPTAPTVDPTLELSAPTWAPTWAPIAPTCAPTAPTDAPMLLIMLVGKKLLDDKALSPVRGGPPLPAECGPPEPPLSSEGVFANSPVPKSTKWIGELLFALSSVKEISFMISTGVEVLYKVSHFQDIF